MSADVNTLCPLCMYTAPECQPRTITSTLGESLDFVSPFTTEEQYKRAAQDVYHPFSPEERYAINEDAVDAGFNPKKVIPTPIEETYDDTKSVNIYSGDWVIAIVSTELLQEATFLAGEMFFKVGNKTLPRKFGTVYSTICHPTICEDKISFALL